MRPVAILLLVAACGGDAAPTTVDPVELPAREFAASALRALEGTVYEALDTAALADVVVGLCRSGGPLPAASRAAVAEVGVPAPPAADASILEEVLFAGVAQVCPERASEDLAAAFLVAVADAIASTGGVQVSDDAALSAGLSACASLDFGSPADGLVTIFAGLFGVEATLEEVLAGAATEEEVLSAGAILAASVTFLCPEHREAVDAFVSEPGA